MSPIGLDAWRSRSTFTFRQHPRDDHCRATLVFLFVLHFFMLHHFFAWRAVMQPLNHPFSPETGLPRTHLRDVLVPIASMRRLACMHWLYFPASTKKEPLGPLPLPSCGGIPNGTSICPSNLRTNLIIIIHLGIAPTEEEHEGPFVLWTAPPADASYLTCVFVCLPVFGSTLSFCIHDVHPLVPVLLALLFAPCPPARLSD